MDLISKKELLSQTGISYGQLYRWKREKLIPEEWFMKKASYTGQETFFPKEQALERVKAIMELKDDYSLEELAKTLMPETSAVIQKEDLHAMEEMEPDLLDCLPEGPYPLPAVAFLIFAGETGRQQEFSKKQWEALAKRCLPVMPEIKAPETVCTLFKMNNEIHAVFSRDAHPLFDDGAVILAGKALGEILSSINVKYKPLFRQEEEEDQ